MKKTLKKVAAYLALVAIGMSTILLGSSTAAAGQVKIEAKYMVRNLTTGQIDYTTSVNAKPGDTVRYMVWYHNTENENSGLNALNLRAVVGLPNSATTSHASTATVAGSNTNSVTNTVSVKSTASTTIDFQEGSVYRVYNSGTNASPKWSTVKISDSLINGSGFVNPNMKPCWNFQESLTFDVKIVAPPVAVNHSITALKYEDVDGDGTHDSGENAVSNWQMTLTGNGVNRTQNTGTDGRTAFTNLGNGTYTVTEGSRTGWRNITPMVRTVVLNGADGAVTFGNQRIPVEVRHTITAIKYEDMDGDGTHDSGEAVVQNWQMALTGNGVNRTQNTGADGRTVFTNLSNGTYTVTEGSRTGWKNITSTVRTVVLSGADASVEFGNQQIVTPPPVVPPTVVPPTVVPPTIITTTGKGNEMPTSGPAEAAAGAVGLTSLGGAAFAWLRSKKDLLGALKKIK